MAEFGYDPPKFNVPFINAAIAQFGSEKLERAESARQESGRTLSNHLLEGLPHRAQQSSPLSRAPHDIHAEIAQHLPAVDLGRLSLTCQDMLDKFFDDALSAGWSLENPYFWAQRLPRTRQHGLDEVLQKIGNLRPIEQSLVLSQLCANIGAVPDTPARDASLRIMYEMAMKSSSISKMAELASWLKTRYPVVSR